MNNKFFGSLTASLLIASLGVPIPGSANPGETFNQEAEPNLNQTDSQPDPLTYSAQPDSVELSSTGSDYQPPQGKPAQSNDFSNDVEKVGEQPSPSSKPPASDSVAKVHSHQISGRKAATLYVKNIPVLTFTGSTATPLSDVKIGEQPTKSSSDSSAQAKALDASGAGLVPKFNSLIAPAQHLSTPFSGELDPGALEANAASADPVWRATVVAARLNQLARNGLDAGKLSVVWDGATRSQNSIKGDRFLIKLDDTILATVDSSTRSAQPTRNIERDALQATNRLRQILGNADPLKEVAGKPAGEQRVALGSLQLRLSGFASWYGPGFHGNPSASGERFNQNAMTAAHRTLPFGTRVLVTNVDNGQSVVVRINDRGPYYGNRVIDLSTAAARMLGLIQSGVAPVRLEVLDSRAAAISP
jgi:rare lipoprotein A